MADFLIELRDGVPNHSSEAPLLAPVSKVRARVCLGRNRFHHLLIRIARFYFPFVDVAIYLWGGVFDESDSSCKNLAQ